MSRNTEYDKELTHLRASFKDGVFAFQGEPLFNRAGKMVIGKLTESDKWAAEAQAICDKMLATYEAKDTDYAADGKPMGNLRMSEEVGVPAWKGVLIRMGDKRRRIESFAQRGTYAVDSEKVDDTLVDLSNYCLLGLLLFREAMNATVTEVTKKNVQDDPTYQTLVDNNFEVQNAYQRLAHLAIYLTVLFRKGANDQDVMPWNTSKEWDELMACYSSIAAFARKNV